MKVGDIYRWSYLSPIMSYHCCTRIAEFDGRVLRDTYWSTGDGRCWTPERAAAELELTFVANREELTPADPSAYDYYGDSDIVDLRHANDCARSNVYLRRGASRSATKMRSVLERTIERSESEIRVASDRIERCRELLAKLETAPLDSIYVLSMGAEAPGR